ncbi:unnamed protein product [Pleuronectes platessa]|uniref:Uncharacterized protein n=1 Tax=Pleuronectes platessa TaxID=8262 RepID=A0A9N7Y9U0_PLEPL|nr:unnamed protein product [Pleuronectes platessa]
MEFQARQAHRTRRRLVQSVTRGPGRVRTGSTERGDVSLGLARRTQLRVKLADVRMKVKAATYTSCRGAAAPANLRPLGVRFLRPLDLQTPGRHVRLGFTVMLLFHRDFVAISLQAPLQLRPPGGSPLKFGAPSPGASLRET